jgi:AsmA-like C-terminal region
MIKKLFYIAGGLFLLLVLAIIVLLMNISTVGSYVVKKVTGGEVAVSKFDYSYESGRIVLKLSDLTIRGNLKGTVKRLDVFANIASRPFLKSTTISDFDLTFSDLKGKTRFIPLPAELLEIKRGALTYNTQKIFIDELRIENLKSGKPFLFSLKARNDSYFKSISISGEGIYKGKSSELNGNMHITGFNLARLSSKLKGTAIVQGPFTFARQSFSFEGPFEMSGFELRDPILERPLTISRYSGKAGVTYANDMADIKVENINFLNTSFFLGLKVGKNDLASFDLSSGFINLKEAKRYISLENIAKGSRKLWESIQEGKVKITRFHHERKKPINADLELKNMEFVYKNMNFNKVEGFLNIDSYKVSISRGRGTFKSSRFSDAAGFVSLARDKQVKVKGNYSVNLRDIPSMLDVGAVKFKNGTTEGTMELDGNEAAGYRISGAGKVEDADVSWQKISASARGSYKFTDDEITFDPLILRKGGTDMAIRGKWSKKSLGIFLKGNLDVDLIKHFATLPFPVKGTALLDVAIRNDDKAFTVNGDVVMDDISFTIPKFIKKDKGIQSTAHISASVKDRWVNIERLSYNLDVLRINGKGVVSPERTMNLDIGINVQAIERVAPLFFFTEDSPQGNLDLNVSVGGLRWPIRKLPSIRGFARINNGFVRLPWMSAPLKDITLTADFKGDAMEIIIKKLAFGKTLLENSKITLEGLEYPKFSLTIDMDTLDLSDFKGESELTVRAIPKENLLAKMAGTFVVSAKNVNLPPITGTQFRINGNFLDRKLSINKWTMNTLGGYADVQGAVDFSHPIPKLNIRGKITSMTSGHFLKTVGAEGSVIEGEGAVDGNLNCEGEKTSEMLDSLNGNADIYSRNGIIKKWNLLAKVFSVLNLYDLFRGKVHFTEAGLQYSKMGASFKIKEGTFTTNNFLIDSPSMLITGNGDIKTKNHEVDGTINVSPLVTVDKTIDKIPILRSILRDKDKGFVYASYNVKGNIEDPDISLNYVETIGGRTIDILKNILTLPAELFEQK